MAYLLLIFTAFGLFALSSFPQEKTPQLPGAGQIQEHAETAKDWAIDTAQTIGSTVRTKALGFLRQQLHAIIDKTVQ